MGDMVTVQMPLDLMREIEKALEECSQDLAVEVSDRYPEDQREIYESYACRWKNDMEPVRHAEKVVQAIRSQRWWVPIHNSIEEFDDD